MTYRAALCVRCDETGRESCPRCGDWVCANHRVQGAAHCVTCAKELRDDLDEARFLYELKQPGEDRGIFASRRSSPLVDAVDWLSARISRALSERRIRKTFARRSRDDIEAWRRRAGVAPTRS
jgi:hypothetical protein